MKEQKEASPAPVDPSPEVQKLIAQLKDRDEVVRLKAAKELGKLKEKAKAALEQLSKVAIGDTDEDVRAVAKSALASIQEAVDADLTDKTVAPMLKALKSKKNADRVAALDQLARLGEKARPTTAAIVTAAMDPALAVREAAAACLEKVDPTLHKHVIAILYDSSFGQQERAVAELGKLRESAKGAVPLLKFRYSSQSSAQSQPDSTSLSALVAIVPDDPLVVNEVLRLAAIPNYLGLRFLDSVSAPNAKRVSALVMALSDPSFRLDVIDRLVKFGAEAKPALPLLKKLKLDGNVKVREAATKAIEAIDADKPE